MERDCLDNFPSRQYQLADYLLSHGPLIKADDQSLHYYRQPIEGRSPVVLVEMNNALMIHRNPQRLLREPDTGSLEIEYARPEANRFGHPLAIIHYPGKQVVGCKIWNLPDTQE